MQERHNSSALAIVTFSYTNPSIWSIWLHKTTMSCNKSRRVKEFNTNRVSHCGDKIILQPSYLHSGIPYIGFTTSFYRNRAQIINYHPMTIAVVYYVPTCDCQLRHLTSSMCLEPRFNISPVTASWGTWHHLCDQDPGLTAHLWLPVEVPDIICVTMTQG